MLHEARVLGSLTVAAGLLASATFSMGKDLCRLVAGVEASDTSVRNEDFDDFRCGLC